MIKVGVIGGAGFTAGELLRLLVNHDGVEISYVHSTSNAGNAIEDVHSDILGSGLRFSEEVRMDVDVLFLCMGHGASKEFMEKHSVPAEVKIVDLSHDFRLEASNEGLEIPFVYGLPELQRELIKGASRIANPGCFATAIQLGLLPLAKAGMLQTEVHVNAVTGSTGAGQKPTATTHFSWRNNNISVYKAFAHQHLGEIGESVKQLQPDFDKAINFIPVRGNFSRGIMATSYLDFEGTTRDAVEIFESFYKDHPFTHVVYSNPHLKQVVNTNNAIVFVEKHGGKLLVISMIDNLLKGASGQALQNMNLLFGLEEMTGLRLKAMAF